MTTLILIASLGVASVCGLRLMSKLDGFLSPRKSADRAAFPRREVAPTRLKWAGSPLGKHAAVLLHSILNHLFG